MLFRPILSDSMRHNTQPVIYDPIKMAARMLTGGSLVVQMANKKALDRQLLPLREYMHTE